LRGRKNDKFELTVGGFIVSHLRNLRASTNPDKADAKHHFGAIYSTDRFPVDVRKYSLYHELSYSLDSLNLGASGEANVIYSQQSYIPRSVSLNLTTQLFGHSVNLFEVIALLSVKIKCLNNLI
jgi:hypothetical protein